MTRQTQNSDKIAILVELFKHCRLSAKKRFLKEVSASGIISSRDIAKMVPIRLAKQPNELKKAMGLLSVLLGTIGVKVIAKKNDDEKREILTNLVCEDLQVMEDDLETSELEQETGEENREKLFEKTYNRKVNLPFKDILGLYLAEARKFRLLSRPAIYLLTSNYRAYRNVCSRNKIIEHNLRLAVNRARRYCGKGIEH